MSDEDIEFVADDDDSIEYESGSDVDILETPDDDGDDFGFEETSTQSSSQGGQNLSKVIEDECDEKKFKLVHEELLFKTIHADVKKLQSYLFIDYFSTTEILKFYEWNFEKCLEEYFNRGKEHVYKQIGLSTYFMENNSDTLVECPVCFDDVKEKKTVTLSTCGHRFCVTCIKNYFISKKDSVKEVTCMVPKCDVVISKKLIVQFVRQSKHERKSELVRDYTRSNKRISYCPTPNCGFVAKLLTNDARENVVIECECTNSYCFSCKIPYDHRPATCKMLEDWMKKVKEDAANMMWMEQNAKKCPKCCVVIVKNGGCNSMSCANCGTSFCWFCLSIFNQLIHNCVFRQNVSSKPDEKEMVKQLDMTRYFGAFEKWKIFNESKELESSISFMKKWLKKCHSVLIEGRDIMANSIVFHFYSFNVTLYDIGKQIDQFDPKLVKRRRRQMRKEKKKNKKREKGKNIEGTKQKDLYQSSRFTQKKRGELIAIEKQIKIFRKMFLFNVEQVEEKLEKLSNYLCNLEEKALLQRKNEVLLLTDMIRKLFKNIHSTVAKKDSYYKDDYS